VVIERMAHLDIIKVHLPCICQVEWFIKVSRGQVEFLFDDKQ
jgi:hypothetical protein